MGKSLMPTPGVSTDPLLSQLRFHKSFVLEQHKSAHRAEGAELPLPARDDPSPLEKLSPRSLAAKCLFAVGDVGSDMETVLAVLHLCHSDLYATAEAAAAADSPGADTQGAAASTASSVSRLWDSLPERLRRAAALVEARAPLLHEWSQRLVGPLYSVCWRTADGDTDGFCVVCAPFPTKASESGASASSLGRPPAQGGLTAPTLPVDAVCMEDDAGGDTGAAEDAGDAEREARLLFEAYTGPKDDDSDEVGA